MTCVDLHIKPSAHTPSKSFVNEISSPSTYTDTDGYTVSYYRIYSRNSRHRVIQAFNTIFKKLPV